MSNLTRLVQKTASVMKRANRVLPNPARTVGIWLVALLFVLPAGKDSAAFVINEDLLKIQAALYPKIILMDINYERKLVNQKISIVIVYPEQASFYAVKLMEYMKAKYSQGLKGFAVDVEIQSFAEIIARPDEATAFYFFPADSRLMRKAADNASLSRLIFVYDPDDLRYGGHIGVNVGSKTRPVINLEAVREKGINLRPVFLKISEYY